MPYDLHGTYYKNAQDAYNTEMAQCAEIDARLAYKASQKNERQAQSHQETIYYMQQHINNLEQRIALLEEKFSKH